LIYAAIVNGAGIMYDNNLGLGILSNGWRDALTHPIGSVALARLRLGSAPGIDRRGGVMPPLLRGWLALLAVVFLSIALLIPASGGARAQAQPPSDPKFDALVEAISKEVVRKLKAEGAIPAAPQAKAAATGAPATGESTTAEDAIEQDSIRLFERAGQTIQHFPEFLHQLAGIPDALSPPAGGLRDLSILGWLIGLAIAVALGAELAVSLALTPLRRRLVARLAVAPGLPPLAGLALLDLVALAAVWAALHAAAAVWFSDGSAQSTFATSVLIAVFSWRLYMLAFRVTFRPALPVARLAEIDDTDARRIYLGVGIAILLVLATRVTMRFMLAHGAESEVVASGQMVGASALALAFIVIAVWLRRPVAGWLRGLSPHAEPGPVVAALSRNWLAIAIPFFLVLGLAQIYGVVERHFNVGGALILTLNVILGLLLLETVADCARRLRTVRNAATGDARPRIGELALRCAHVVIIVSAVDLVVVAWLRDVFALDDGSGTWMTTMSTIGAVIIVAYCAWEGIHFATARYVLPPPSAAGALDHDGEQEEAVTASRLTTLMPLLRVALVVAIVVLAVLTILSQLGVNVTALVAGASVVGLAISFGSQTLVKDIVSGVFYLVDDAFRVGEYIDCGKAKGTVEGFTLRSLKLRHQNGQVHTIPFGQLGQITNFSRDWTTMKFNLRFVRTTDIEVLRKAVKRIGQEMLEDPEIAAEILVPLKMQGVIDIADNALVVRFKFTARPNKPTFVYREALKRIFRSLPGAGIEFANAMVAVQTVGATPADAQISAAAARAISAQSAAAQAQTGT
jgi:small-conductance mechanosensitive channel